MYMGNIRKKRLNVIYWLVEFQWAPSVLQKNVSSATYIPVIDSKTCLLRIACHALDIHQSCILNFVFSFTEVMDSTSLSVKTVYIVPLL